MFISSIDSLVPATTLPFVTGVKHVVTIDGENVRNTLVSLMTAVQARMLADKSDDTKCFEALIQVNILHYLRTRHPHGCDTRGYNKQQTTDRI